MATIEQVAEQAAMRARKYQGALAQLEAYASTDLPVYRDGEFLRSEILRIARECREEIEAARK